MQVIKSEREKFTEALVEMLELAIAEAKERGFTNGAVVIGDNEDLWMDARHLDRLRLLGGIEMMRAEAIK